MNARRECDSRYRLSDGLVLSCQEPHGHTGSHLAPVVVNGQECSTGWTDLNEGAYREQPEPWPGEDYGKHYREDL